GADRDEQPRPRADLLDPRDVVGRRHRSFDERDVVRPLDLGTRRLREVGDLDRICDREQLALAVEQRQLAAVAGREFPDGEGRLHSSRTSISRSISSKRKTGPSRQISVGPSWQWPQWPRPQRMLRSIETYIDSFGIPRSNSARAAKVIISSGPQTRAT